MFSSFHYSQCHEGTWGKRIIASCILSLSTRWRWASLQTLAALSPRNNPLVPIKKVGFLGPRGCLNALEKRKKMFLPCWKKPYFFSPPAGYLVTPCPAISCYLVTTYTAISCYLVTTCTAISCYLVTICTAISCYLVTICTAISCFPVLLYIILNKNFHILSMEHGM
jgi:hypothetical protein